MSRKRVNRRNKIKRTSSYRGYNRFGRYRSYSSKGSGSDSRSLGKAVVMAVAVVAAASLIIFSCITFVPKLIAASKKTFISSASSEPSKAVSLPESKDDSSKEEGSKPSEGNSKTESSNSEEPKAESSKAESKPQKDSGYDDNGVFIYKKVGYAPFKGSDDAAAKYADCINRVAATLDTSINVYSMVVPTHSAITAESLQKKNVSSEKKNIAKIKDSLSENITFIDVQDALREKKDKYIYYNTDESWTSLGAYYAYQQFCAAADITAADMDETGKKQLEGFAGNLISSTKSDKNKDGNPDLLKNLDTVEYYTFGDYECGLWKTATSGEIKVPFTNENISSKNALEAFCYGDVSLFKVYTGKDTGKRLCIVKDGYGSALAPYFTENYDEIHVIDSRYFDGSLTGYCYNHSITDVMFVNGVNNANTKDYIEALSDLSIE